VTVSDDGNESFGGPGVRQLTRGLVNLPFQCASKSL